MTAQDFLAAAIAREIAAQVAPLVVAEVRRAISGHSGQLLSRAEVAARLGRSVSTIKRLQAEPEFPKPVRQSGGRPQWRSTEIDAYADSLPASSSANSSADGE